VCGFRVGSGKHCYGPNATTDCGCCQGIGRLCPVEFYVPLGLAVIMPRLDSVDRDDLPERDAYDGLPVDYKLTNFGKLDDRIVLIDYGSK